MYISRTFPARTSSRAARRNKSGRDRNRRHGMTCRSSIAITAGRRRMKMNLQVPLILLPADRRATNRRKCAMAGSGQHVSAQALKATRVGRPACSSSIAGTGGRNIRKLAGVLKFRHCLPRLRRIAILPAACFRDFQRRQKSLQLKFSRALCIHQRGRADISFAHHVCKARDGQLQLFRIGKAGKKQAALRGARRADSAASVILRIGAPGGFACKRRRSNFKSIFESRSGTGSCSSFPYAPGRIDLARNISLRRSSAFSKSGCNSKRTRIDAAASERAASRAQS